MKIEDPLRLTWLKGIQQTTGERELTNDKFFNKKLITVNRVEDANNFSLYVSNPKNLKRFFSHEADRFASASFESLSIEFSELAQSRSIGWILIRAYYSAFFAVHSLLRISGWACTKLSANHINFVNREIFNIYPGSPQQKNGLYLLKAHASGVEIVCAKLDSGQGGSHEALWNVLEGFLSFKLEKILMDGDSTDFNVQDAVKVIDGFLGFLEKKGGAGWLSKVRNNINYSHQYGAWFPYKGSTCDASRVYSSLKLCSASNDLVVPSVKSDELIQFSEACAFLVSLCRLSIQDLIYRSPSNSPFRHSSGRVLEQLERSFKRF
ncbi:hypothetical protein K5D33_25360 [Pseudomonas cichorii]|nr:hypothetical protein [Pseudomonas cichorii]MBX8538035.1 hypothetical protein [Pseudomonas cichorii]